MAQQLGSNAGAGHQAIGYCCGVPATSRNSQIPSGLCTLAGVWPSAMPRPHFVRLHSCVVMVHQQICLIPNRVYFIRAAHLWHKQFVRLLRYVPCAMCLNAWSTSISHTRTHYTIVQRLQSCRGGLGGYTICDSCSPESSRLFVMLHNLMLRGFFVCLVFLNSE